MNEWYLQWKLLKEKLMNQNLSLVCQLLMSGLIFEMFLLKGYIIIIGLLLVLIEVCFSYSSSSEIILYY